MMNFLKKKHSEMTREELLYALEWEKAMLERIENALMLPDSTDESLELAKPLLKVIDESIEDINKFLLESS
jgi:DNA-binding XRE family transcriptional regulator